MTTIYEVAKLAGVSPATVSRVFNGIKVRADLHKRVLDAAEKLNFTPNGAARQLRTKNSEIIALIIPDIDNPFWTMLARGVEDVANANGYSLILCNSDEDAQKEDDYLKALRAIRVAGIVIAPTQYASHELVEMKKTLPVVCVDRSAGEAFDVIQVDNIAIGQKATDILLDKKATSLACVTGPKGIETAVDRMRGWKLSLLEHDSVDKMWGDVLYEDFRFEGGWNAAKRIFSSDNPPDGIFVTNNLLALGMIDYMDKHGISDPILAFVGALPHGVGANSNCYAVNLPTYEMGEQAAQTLFGRIGGSQANPRKIIISGGETNRNRFQKN